MADRYNCGKRRKGKSNESGSSNAFSMPLTERQQLAYLLSMTAKESKEESNEDVEAKRVKRAKLSPISSINRPRNKNGETQLHICTTKGEVEAVKNIVKQGADVNCRDNADWTPLHEACFHGHYKIAKFLLKSGANVNAVGLEGDTPLHDASSNSHLKIVLLLLRHGADPHQKNDHGQSSVDVAEGEEVIEALQKFTKEMLKDLKPKKDVTPEKQQFKDDDNENFGKTLLLKSSSKSNKKTISNIADFLEANSPLEVLKESCDLKDDKVGSLEVSSNKSGQRGSPSLQKVDAKCKMQHKSSLQVIGVAGNSGLKEKSDNSIKYLDVSKKSKVNDGGKSVKVKEGLSGDDKCEKSITKKRGISETKHSTFIADRKRHLSESSSLGGEKIESLKREGKFDNKMEDSDDDIKLSALVSKESKSDSQHTKNPKKIRKQSLSGDSESKDKYLFKDILKDGDRKTDDSKRGDSQLISKQVESNRKDGISINKNQYPLQKSQSFEHSLSQAATKFKDAVMSNKGDRNSIKKPSELKSKFSSESVDRNVSSGELQHVQQKSPAIHKSEMKSLKTLKSSSTNEQKLVEPGGVAYKHMSSVKKPDEGDKKLDRPDKLHRERKISTNNNVEDAIKEIQSSSKFKKAKVGSMNEHQSIAASSTDLTVKSISNDRYFGGKEDLTPRKTEKMSSVKAPEKEGKHQDVKNKAISSNDVMQSLKTDVKAIIYCKPDKNRSKLQIENNDMYSLCDDKNTVKGAQVSFIETKARSSLFGDSKECVKDSPANFHVKKMSSSDRNIENKNILKDSQDKLQGKSKKLSRDDDYSLKDQHGSFQGKNLKPALLQEENNLKDLHDSYYRKHMKSPSLRDGNDNMKDQHGSFHGKNMKSPILRNENESMEEQLGGFQGKNMKSPILLDENDSMKDQQGSFQGKSLKLASALDDDNRIKDPVGSYQETNIKVSSIREGNNNLKDQLNSFHGKNIKSGEIKQEKLVSKKLENTQKLKKPPDTPKTDSSDTSGNHAKRANDMLALSSQPSKKIKDSRSLDTFFEVGNNRVPSETVDINQKKTPKVDKPSSKEHEKIVCANQDAVKMKHKSKAKMNMKNFLLKAEESGSDCQSRNVSYPYDEELSLKTYKNYQSLKLKKDKLADKEKSKKDELFGDFNELKSEVCKTKNNLTKYRKFAEDSDDDVDVTSSEQVESSVRKPEKSNAISASVTSTQKYGCTKINELHKGTDKEGKHMTGVSKKETGDEYKQSGNCTHTSDSDVFDGSFILPKSEKFKCPHSKEKGESLVKKKSSSKEKLNRIQPNNSEISLVQNQNMTGRKNDLTDKVSLMEKAKKSRETNGEYVQKGEIVSASSNINFNYQNPSNISMAKEPAVKRLYNEKDDAKLKPDHINKASSSSVEQKEDQSEAILNVSARVEKFCNQNSRSSSKAKLADIHVDEKDSSILNRRLEEKRIKKEEKMKEKLKGCITFTEVSWQNAKHTELAYDKESKKETEHKTSGDEKIALLKDVKKYPSIKDDELKVDKGMKQKSKEYYSHDTKGTILKQADLKSHEEVNASISKVSKDAHDTLPFPKQKPNYCDSKSTPKIKSGKDRQENEAEISLKVGGGHKASPSVLKSKELCQPSKLLSLKFRETVGKSGSEESNPSAKVEKAFQRKALPCKSKSKEKQDCNPHLNQRKDSNHLRISEVVDKGNGSMKVPLLKNERSEATWGRQVNLARPVETNSHGENSECGTKGKKVSQASSFTKAKSKDISISRDPSPKYKDVKSSKEITGENTESRDKICENPNEITKYGFGICEKDDSRGMISNIDKEMKRYNIKEDGNEHEESKHSNLIGNTNLQIKSTKEPVLPFKSDVVISDSKGQLNLSRSSLVESMESSDSCSRKSQYFDISDSEVDSHEYGRNKEQVKYIFNSKTSFDKHDSESQGYQIGSVVPLSSPLSKTHVKKDNSEDRNIDSSSDVNFKSSHEDLQSANSQNEGLLLDEKSGNNVDGKEAVPPREIFNVEGTIIEEHILTCGPKIEKPKYKSHNAFKREHSDPSIESLRKKHKRKHSDESLHDVCQKAKKSRSLDSDNQDSSKESKCFPILPGGDLSNHTNDSKLYLESRKRFKQSKSVDSSDVKMSKVNINSSEGSSSSNVPLVKHHQDGDHNTLKPLKHHQDGDHNTLKPFKHHQDGDHSCVKVAKHHQDGDLNNMKVMKCTSNKDERSKSSSHLKNIESGKTSDSSKSNVLCVKSEFKHGARSINMKDSDILHKAAKLKEVDLNSKVGLNNAALELVKKKKRKRHSESRDSASDLRVLKVPTELISIESTPPQIKASRKLSSGELKDTEGNLNGASVFTNSSDLKYPESTKLPVFSASNLKIPISSCKEVEFPETTVDTKLFEDSSNDTSFEMELVFNKEKELSTSSFKSVESPDITISKKLPETVSKVKIDYSNEKPLIKVSNEVKASESSSNEHQICNKMEDAKTKTESTVDNLLNKEGMCYANAAHLPHTSPQEIKSAAFCNHIKLENSSSIESKIDETSASEGQLEQLPSVIMKSDGTFFKELASLPEFSLNEWKVKDVSDAAIQADESAEQKGSEFSNNVKLTESCENTKSFSSEEFKSSKVVPNEIKTEEDSCAKLPTSCSNGSSEFLSEEMKPDHIFPSEVELPAKVEMQLDEISFNSIEFDESNNNWDGSNNMGFSKALFDGAKYPDRSTESCLPHDVSNRLLQFSKTSCAAKISEASSLENSFSEVSSCEFPKASAAFSDEIKPAEVSNKAMDASNETLVLEPSIDVESKVSPSGNTSLEVSSQEMITPKKLSSGANMEFSSKEIDIPPSSESVSSFFDIHTKQELFSRRIPDASECQLSENAKRLKDSENCNVAPFRNDPIEMKRESCSFKNKFDGQEQSDDAVLPALISTEADEMNLKAFFEEENRRIEEKEMSMINCIQEEMLSSMNETILSSIKEDNFEPMKEDLSSVMENISNSLKNIEKKGDSTIDRGSVDSHSEFSQGLQEHSLMNTISDSNDGNPFKELDAFAVEETTAVNSEENKKKLPDDHIGYDRADDLNTNSEVNLSEQQSSDDKRDEENQNAVVNLLNMNQDFADVDENIGGTLMLNSSTYISKEESNGIENFMDECNKSFQDDSAQSSAFTSYFDSNKTDGEDLSNIFAQLNQTIKQDQLSQEGAYDNEMHSSFNSTQKFDVPNSTSSISTPQLTTASITAPDGVSGTHNSNIDIYPSSSINDYCLQISESGLLNSTVKSCYVETSEDNNKGGESSLPYSCLEKGGIEKEVLNAGTTTLGDNVDLTLKNDEFSELILPATLTTVTSFGQRYNDLDSIDASDLLKTEKVPCTNDILSNSSDSIILKKDLIDGQLGFSTNLSSDEIISKFADCILELDDTDNTYSLREYIPPTDTSDGHQDKQFVSTISSISSSNLGNQSTNIVANDCAEAACSNAYYHSSLPIYMPSVPTFNASSMTTTDGSSVTCISQPLYVSTVTTRLSTSDEKLYSPKHIFARGKLYSPKTAVSSSNNVFQNRRVSIEPCDMLRSLIESDIPVVPDAAVSSVPSVSEKEKPIKDVACTSEPAKSEADVVAKKPEKPIGIIPRLRNWREAIRTRCSNISHCGNMRDLDRSLSKIMREPKYEEVTRKCQASNLPMDMLMQHASEKEKLRVHMVQEWCRVEQSIDLLSKERGPISGISVLHYQKEEICRKLGTSLDFKCKATPKPDFQKLRNARLVDLQDKFKIMQEELEKRQQLEIESHQKYEQLDTIFNQKEMLRKRYLRLRNKINL